jgi:hypothetical protein
MTEYHEYNVYYHEVGVILMDDDMHILMYTCDDEIIELPLTCSVLFDVVLCEGLSPALFAHAKIL